MNFLYSISMEVWKVLLSSGVMLVLLVIAALAAYLHYIHLTLKHVPGPTRSSFWLGNLPEVRRAIEKDHKFIAQVVTELSEKYGNTFVLWFIHKPVIFCISPEAIRKALIADNYPKSEEFSKTFGFILGYRFIGYGLVTEFNHDRWFPRRTALNHAFSRKFLRCFMDTFNTSADMLVHKLKPEADGKRTIQLSNFLHRTTLDIIGQIAFGVDFDTINDASSPFPLALSKALEGFQTSINHPGKALIPFLLTKERQETKNACALLRKTAKQILLNHKATVEANKDSPESVLTLLVKTHLINGTEHKLDFAIDDFLSIFIAGQETSATVIGFAILELCRKPEMVKRALEEIDSILDKDHNIIDFDDLARFEFIHDVIRETLRLYPPAPLLFRQPQQDFEVDGYKVPGGTGVGFGAYGCARSSEFTLNPEEFMPDRWQEASAYRPATFAYFPFSLGPRNCIGKNFAMIETKVLLVKLLQTFKIDLDMNQSFEAIDKTTLTPKDGVKCTLSLRADE